MADGGVPEWEQNTKNTARLEARHSLADGGVPEWEQNTKNGDVMREEKATRLMLET